MALREELQQLRMEYIVKFGNPPEVHTAIATTAKGNTWMEALTQIIGESLRPASGIVQIAQRDKTRSGKCVEAPCLYLNSEPSPSYLPINSSKDK